MNICDNCGKGLMRGNQVSHAKNRTKRVYLPNLHIVSVVVGGVKKKMKLCAKCVRKLKIKNQISKIKNTNQK